MKPVEVEEKFKKTLREIEVSWATKTLKPNVLGFQIQPGTKWLPGLVPAKLEAYEARLGIMFPDDLRKFYLLANGTDIPNIDLHGSDGRPQSFGIGIYSYPSDIEEVEHRIRDLLKFLPQILSDIESDGIELGPNPKFVPVFGHRFVLASGNPNSSVVLSIYEDDAIVYGEDMETYLRHEFL